MNRDNQRDKYLPPNPPPPPPLRPKWQNAPAAGAGRGVL